MEKTITKTAKVVVLGSSRSGKSSLVQCILSQTKEHQPPLAEAHPGVQLYQRSIKEKVSRQRVNASLVINAYDCGPLSEYSSVIRHVLSWRDCVYVITIDLTKSKDDQKADLDAAIFFLLANVSVMHHPQCPFLVVGTKKKKVSRFNAMDSERLFEEYESSEHLNIDSFQYILLDVEDPSSSDSAVFCKTVFDLARVATREQKSIIPLVTVIKEHRQRLPCVCTVREVSDTIRKRMDDLHNAGIVINFCSSSLLSLDPARMLWVLSLFYSSGEDLEWFTRHSSASAQPFLRLGSFVTRSTLSSLLCAFVKKENFQLVLSRICTLCMSFSPSGALKVAIPPPPVSRVSSTTISSATEEVEMLYLLPGLRPSGDLFMVPVPWRIHSESISPPVGVRWLAQRWISSRCMGTTPSWLLLALQCRLERELDAQCKLYANAMFLKHSSSATWGLLVLVQSWHNERHNRLTESWGHGCLAGRNGDRSAINAVCAGEDSSGLLSVIEAALQDVEQTAHGFEVHSLCPACAQVPGRYSSVFQCEYEIRCEKGHELSEEDLDDGVEDVSLSIQGSDLWTPKFPSEFYKSGDWTADEVNSAVRYTHLTQREAQAARATEFERIKSLFSRFRGLDSRAHDMWIEEIVYIQNKELEAQFMRRFIQKLSASILCDRRWVELRPDRRCFCASDDEETIAWRMWIKNTFNSYTQMVSGNDGVNLVPVWTRLSVEEAKRVARENFCLPPTSSCKGSSGGETESPCELDMRYGRGLYFTQYPSFADRRLTSGSFNNDDRQGGSAQGDVLLLSWALMGKVYPVCENPLSEEGAIRNQPCRDGFSSHYAVLQKGAGGVLSPCTPTSSPEADIVVLFATEDILPRYMIHYKHEKSKHQARAMRTVRAVAGRRSRPSPSTRRGSEDVTSSSNRSVGGGTIPKMKRTPHSSVKLQRDTSLSSPALGTTLTDATEGSSLPVDVKISSASSPTIASSADSSSDNPLRSLGIILQRPSEQLYAVINPHILTHFQSVAARSSWHTLTQNVQMIIREIKNAESDERKQAILLALAYTLLKDNPITCPTELFDMMWKLQESPVLVVARLASMLLCCVFSVNLSAKYFYRHYLDFDDKVQPPFLALEDPDCFINYDRGQGIFYDVGRFNHFVALEAWQDRCDPDGREILCVRAPAWLKSRMKQVGLKDRLNGWMAQITVALSNIDNDDVTGRALCIAQLAGVWMGGTAVDIESRSKQDLKRIKSLLKTDVVPVGLISYGLCRHRSFLFKVLADAACLPSRLVRGFWSSGFIVGTHGWNVVRVLSKGENGLQRYAYKIVDVMRSSAALLDDGTLEAQMYQRTGGSVGGRSIDDQVAVSSLSALRFHEELGVCCDGSSVRAATMARASGENAEKFAVKSIRLDQSPERRDRAVREANIYRELHHPNITAFKDSFIENDRLWIIMEKMDGTLEDVMLEGSSYKKMHLSEILAYSLDIVQALTYLQDRGIVYRDLKPSNVLLSRNHNRAKLADFGISKHMDDLRLGNHTIAGTCGYMAPELVIHAFKYALDVNKLDVYGYGVLLGSMICGAPPLEYDADTVGRVQPKLLPLYQQCVAEDPSSRPLFSVVLQQLSFMMVELAVSADGW